MPFLRITPAEFSELVVIYLTDVLIHPEKHIEIEESEMFKDVVDELNSKGMKIKLINHFRKTNYLLRTDYRRMRSIFEGKGSSTHLILDRK